MIRSSVRFRFFEFGCLREYETKVFTFRAKALLKTDLQKTEKPVVVLQSVDGSYIYVNMSVGLNI
jgi:hypothetical protein